MVVPQNSEISLQNTEIFKGWIVYLRGDIFVDFKKMPEGLGNAYQKYVHHKSHKLLIEGLDPTADISKHQTGMEEAEKEFRNIASFEAEELWKYIESIRLESKERNIDLRRVVEEKAIAIMDV